MSDSTRIAAATDACIVGWAHSPFGKLEEPDLEALLARVGRAAIEDAGIEPSEVDAGFVGVFGEGFTQQGFPSSLVLHSIPELRFKPLTRFENACATGSAAIHGALDFLAAKRGRFALVLGAEKMTSTPGAKVGDILLSASYRKTEQEIQGGFAGVFGRIAETYFQRHGDQSDALAAIAAKNHKNGVDNPWAQMRKDLGFEFCRRESEKNPFVAPPLKRTDCSLGLGRRRRPGHHRRRDGARHGQGRPLPRRRAGERLPAHRLPRDHPLRRPARGLGAGARPGRPQDVTDLSFVETHDCFTIAELIEYEAMGLASEGQGARAALEGWTAKDGRLPVNRSGGLKSKGHPIGATGISMHALTAMQLTGQAGAMQLPKADLGGVFNMGGAAVANYVSILERTQ